MKNAIVCVWVVVLFVSVSSSLLAGPDWRVELVPSRNSEGKGAVIYAKKPLDKFYVVLHNTSGKDQRVWRDWCPWGYGNLSLLAEIEGGKKIPITVKPKSWGKAYPDAALVKKGKSYVFEIHLAGSVWRGAGKLPLTPFKLTGIYQVKETPESEQKKVWCGKVKSEPLQVTIRK